MTAYLLTSIPILQVVLFKVRLKRSYSGFASFNLVLRLPPAVSFKLKEL